jgi:hypothetical protein
MLSKNKLSPYRHSLIVFFLLAFGITWSFSGFAYLSRFVSATVFRLPVLRSFSVLFILFGPALAAASIAWLFEGERPCKNWCPAFAFGGLVELGLFSFSLTYSSCIFQLPVSILILAVLQPIFHK